MEEWKHCTSTPRRKTLPEAEGFVMSYEASSIHASEAEVESTSLSSTSRVFDSTDDDVILRKNYRYGNDWKYLQPKRIEGIYHDILKNPPFVYDIASKWAEDLVQQPEVALKTFIQFVTDLCGYQNIDINEMYKGNYQQMVKYMEKTMPEAFKLKNLYLVKTKCYWGRQSCLAFSLFIQKIVEEAYANNRLFDKKFWNELHLYLNTLASSESFITKHTAVFIVAKFITGLVKLLPELQTEGDDRFIKKDYIRILIESHLKIVLANCEMEVKNNYLDQMKIMCIREFKEWFERDPDYFFFQETLLNLLKYLCGSHSSLVCEEAMKAAIHLIRCAKENHLQIMLSVLFETMQDSLLDVNTGTVVKSIEFFIELLHREAFACIKPIVLHNITLSTFNKNLKIARAAGCFIIKYFRCCRDVINQKDYYISLIKLLKFDEKIQMYSSFLVESITDFCPEIKMWDEMTNLLFSEDLNCGDKKLLLEIMHDSMFLCATGISSSKRSLQPKQIDENEKSELTNFYLVNFQRLAEFCWDDDKCLQRTIDLLGVLNYDNAINYQISIILETLVRIIQSKEKTMIEAACKVLYAYTGIERIRPEAENTVILLKSKITNDFKNIIHNQNKSSQFGSVTKSFLITNIFYKYFELEELNWIDVYVQWTNTSSFNDPHTTYHLVNCQHYLTWKLKQLLQNVENQEMHSGISELSIKCNQFLTSCFNIINGDNRKIQVTAFRCVADLHIDFFKLTKPIISSNDIFEPLMLKIKDEDRNILKIFIQTYVFKELARDENITFEKCLDLKRYLDMINLHILPTIDVSHVFEHLHSHEKQYGAILKGMLQNIISTQPMHGAVLMHKTLVEVYAKIPLDDSNLRGLVNAFSSLIRKADETALDLLMLSVIFAKQHPNYMNFMHLFLAKLSDSQKEKLIEKIKNELGSEQPGEPMKKFLKKLESKK